MCTHGLQNNPNVNGTHEKLCSTLIFLLNASIIILIIEKQISLQTCLSLGKPVVILANEQKQNVLFAIYKNFLYVIQVTTDSVNFSCVFSNAGKVSSKLKSTEF